MFFESAHSSQMDIEKLLIVHLPLVTVNAISYHPLLVVLLSEPLYVQFSYEAYLNIIRSTLR